MALRRNVAERVPVVEEVEEREARVSSYNDKIINISRNEVVRRSQVGEIIDGSHVWPRDAVTHFPQRLVPAFVRNAIIDASPPLFVFAIASLAIFVFAAIIASSPHVAGEIEVPSYTLRPELSQWEEKLLGTWQHWDGLWYLKIAKQGYNDYDYSTAFFPLYPLVVRIIGSILEIHLLLAGMLLSLISYAVALVYLYKLGKMEIDEEAARRSVIYLAIFPTAFFFLAVYTESMFLALSVAIFFYARKGHWTTVGILGLLASLTRSTGLLLALPLFIEYLQQRNLRLREIRSDILNLALVPAGTAIYAIYDFFAFGDPLIFLHAQIHWERSFATPWQTLASAWDFALNDANIPLVTEPDGSPIYQALYISNLISGHALNLAFFVLGLVLIIAAFKTLRPAYGVYAFLVIIIPLFNPSETMPLLSTPRFIAVLFPIFFALALIGKNRIAHWAISATFVTVLALFLIRFASWYWVA